LWIVAVIVVGSLALLAIILLSIPFDLAVDISRSSRTNFSGRWEWAFGLVRQEIKPAKKKKKGRRTSFRKIIQRAQSGMSLMHIEGLPGQIIRLVKRLFRRVQIRNLEAELTIGLEEPDATFCVFVLAEPLNRILEYSIPYSVCIHPSFVGPCFQGFLKSEIRVFPVRLVLPLLMFVFSVPVFKVIMNIVGEKWKQR